MATPHFTTVYRAVCAEEWANHNRYNTKLGTTWTTDKESAEEAMHALPDNGEFLGRKVLSAMAPASIVDESGEFFELDPTVLRDVQEKVATDGWLSNLLSNLQSGGAR